MPASQDISAAHLLSPEQVLLGFLSQRPAHGYELHRRLEAELSQIWRLGLNQTYTILNRLEARGFIRQAEAHALPAVFGPAARHRRRFELTEAGRQRFERWLATPTPATIRAVRVEFTTRLYFAAAVNPELAAGLIDAQLLETRRSLDRLEAVLRGVPEQPPFNRLGLRLRVGTLASLMAWLEECRASLTPPAAAAGPETGGGH